jgi:hypothetical protein
MGQTSISASLNNTTIKKNKKVILVLTRGERRYAAATTPPSATVVEAHARGAGWLRPIDADTPRGLIARYKHVYVQVISFRPPRQPALDFQSLVLISQYVRAAMV